MTLIVCPAASLAEICRTRSPSHVVALIAPRGPEPRGTGAAKRLVLAFNDIVAPQEGLVAPDRSAIETLLRFGQDWPGSRPLVVSCEFGISRSTAAAFCLACGVDPGRPEREIAEALRLASLCATPNALVVSLADDLLGRGGRMRAAVAAIGRGADYEPYRSFDLPVARHPAGPACTPLAGML